jgi:riboflavin synthase
MFTGIIQAVGRVVALQPEREDVSLRIDADSLGLSDVRDGDSIAVSGVCLTVVRREGNEFEADVSHETLSRTAFTALRPGDRVNLEKALTLSAALGGHLVSGHVDGVGEVLSRRPAGRCVQFSLRAPDALSRYIAEKGSISVDGVSLTVNGVEGAVFEVNTIPHTLVRTTLGDYQVGRHVNLEVDIIARYLERLILHDGTVGARGVTWAFSNERGAEHGIIKGDEQL